MTAQINVDPREIDKFEELASRWWDPGSEFKPLHDINPLRHRWIAELSSGLRGKQILDVGCGGGILTESLASDGADVTGIDMGEGPLAVARLHLLESGLDIQYQRIPVERLAQEMPGHFDVVTCMEMLEHVPDPASVVAACQRLVKPGGPVFFSTINRNPKAYLFAILGAEYLLRLLPKGTHDYAKFITPAELGRWVRKAGLELERMMGLTYNPLTREYRLDSRDVSVNYMIQCRRPLIS
ncbi:MAG: bifunctional 2-polyprenyl-6-hydroxyphenol methylase/3-demethylubiquinol 3-O-methyltransferase UbiG [Gammaproteobacteria bacterium]|nr:bifunctional 2-polyprenyl-6-hydroxyphenol methylase/3-demethylubiquinol 3-O-methyltransferase UbiG [Gammaproteobacteria bacterium]MBU1654958.1 bifunctional 2-polyprenyl-6-hydroxyphenol methylase/3-demethylubiquinol 3-O-methyltransferase UbiG [Gammaproteobacteria bacterium]MBU1960076.1 bifunctional 2-polyprenyl-6-hydroxyphenol methylase/3-demethylubiquinol 3-O-methyltransferase UbiG [Gammaproteobacteria bacterium]